METARVAPWMAEEAAVALHLENSPETQPWPQMEAKGGRRGESHADGIRGGGLGPAASGVRGEVRVRPRGPAWAADKAREQADPTGG